MTLLVPTRKLRVGRWPTRKLRVGTGGKGTRHAPGSVVAAVAARGRLVDAVDRNATDKVGEFCGNPQTHAATRIGLPINGDIGIPSGLV